MSNGSQTLQKYKELYELAVSVFDEELTRSYRLDEKASRYFSVITLILGITGFFAKEVFKKLIPPASNLDWIILAIYAILIGLLLVEWLMLLAVLKIQDYMKVPLDLDFFNDNKLSNVYYGLSKGIKNNLTLNRIKGDKKAYWLKKSYSFLVAIIGVISLLIMTTAFKIWIESTG